MLVGIGAVVVGVDQLTKWLVRAYIEPGGAVTVIPACFDLVHGHNTGMAFGLFRNSPLLFTALAVGSIPLLAWGYRALPLSRAGRVAWAAIVGGATGNLVDRLTLGHVTDFIDWYVGTYHWYAFNLADACISVGVFSIVLLNLFTPAQPSAPVSDASGPV